MYTILILDDDPLSVQIIKAIVESNFKSYCKEFLIASSLADARTKLQTVTPDILFLDVKLHDEIGFDLLNNELDKNMEVVIVSGSETYAIEAIRRNVFDYLVKPVKPADLERVFQRVYIKKFQKADHSTSLPLASDKLNISTQEGIQLFDINQISFFEANNLYCNVFIVNGDCINSNRPLKYFDELLDKNQFFRIQKSYIINVKQIEKVNKSNGGFVIMKGSSVEIPISKQIKKEFYELLKI